MCRTTTFWNEGRNLGRGPERGDPRYRSYDSYDVAPDLRDRDYTVAVLACYYGCMNAYSRDARAGLFVQLDIGASDAWSLRRTVS